MYFLIEDGDLLKTIILFGIKLALILKTNLIVNLLTIYLQHFRTKKFLRQIIVILVWL